MYFKRWKTAQKDENTSVLAVVRRSRKFWPRHRPPSWGQNLISCRCSLPLPTNPVWRCNFELLWQQTHPHTHPPTCKHTGLITIHCATGSMQCKNCTFQIFHLKYFIVTSVCNIINIFKNTQILLTVLIVRYPVWRSTSCHHKIRQLLASHRHRCRCDDQPAICLQAEYG